MSDTLQKAAENVVEVWHQCEPGITVAAISRQLHELAGALLAQAKEPPVAWRYREKGEKRWRASGTFDPRTLIEGWDDNDWDIEELFNHLAPTPKEENDG